MKTDLRNKRDSVPRPLRRPATLKAARAAARADRVFMPRRVARAIAGQCRIGAAYYGYQT